MRFPDVGGVAQRAMIRLFQPALVELGSTSASDARTLADAERSLGLAPDGCAWLDERTVADLDLPLVHQAIGRTTTPHGAQALWRWLVAPSTRLDVLDARELRLSPLVDARRRDSIRAALADRRRDPPAYLPRLLWDPPPDPVRTGLFALLVGMLVGCALLARWWPPLVIGSLVVFVINLVVDDWLNLRLAHHARALETLGHVLATSARIVDRGLDPDTGAVAAELRLVAPLRKRINLLTVRDPFGLFDLLRSGFLVRPFTLARCLRLLDEHRDRLRRIVLWLGELDALVAIATLRAERPEVCVPELDTGVHVDARAIVHPAIAGAIGNDLELAGSSLLVTGSNMSGKSTFLRALGINAICAQSIHTTFGAWRAGLVTVASAMRISDDTAAGLSAYAAEVAAVGTLVAAVSRDATRLPALLLLDEPFSGTNPAIRVPIVVAVLDYLAEHDLVIAATHDLDVAATVGARFARGYFSELDGPGGAFDYRLHAGIVPSINALALLERAGYPDEIISAVHRMAR